MKYLFAAWGGIGFLANLVNLLSLFTSTSVGVGTSAYAGAIALIWIGGMLLFGLGSLLFRGSASDIHLLANGESITVGDDNPYHPLTPEGQAWVRGVADRERSR
jgi:hypothetical protein